MKVYDNQLVQLGEGAVLDDGVIIGYPPSRDKESLLTIGPGARIRSGSVIYGGSRIGSNLETGHNVVIREGNIIGDNLRIWTNCFIDYSSVIGNNVKMHVGSQVTQYSVIEDDVFLAGGVIFANDMHPACPDAAKCMQGPHIKRGVQIGIGCCILPRITIGEYAVIGSGSVVTRDIPAGVVAFGNPAKIVCTIDQLTCKTGRRDKPYDHLVRRMKDAYTVS